jgi:nicotinamidase-related amidase
MDGGTILLHINSAIFEASNHFCNKVGYIHVPAASRITHLVHGTLLVLARFRSDLLGI